MKDMIKHKVIWYSFALLFLCILVLTVSVSGQEIKVSPEFIEIDLKGGEYNTTILTVKWTGSDTIQCFISTNITSDCSGNDSEGINVTYSEPSPFNLTPNVDYIIEMTIKVASNLMPGIYIITTNFSCEVEEPPKEGGEDNGGAPHWYPIDYLPGYIPLEPEDEEPEGEEPDDEEPTDEEPTDEEPEGQPFPFWMLGIVMLVSFAISGIVMLLYLIDKKKKKAEKLGGGENE